MKGTLEYCRRGGTQVKVLKRRLTSLYMSKTGAIERSGEGRPEEKTE